MPMSLARQNSNETGRTPTLLQLPASLCELKSVRLSASHLRTDYCKALGKTRSLSQDWKDCDKRRSCIYLPFRIKMKSKY